ncbi:hypothetical protein [Bradyrhizobium sp. URHC0002]
MPDPHDVQCLSDQLHIWAEARLREGACASCIVVAMTSEAFHLAYSVGALDVAKTVAERYAHGHPGPIASLAGWVALPSGIEPLSPP